MKAFRQVFFKLAILSLLLLVFGDSSSLYAAADTMKAAPLVLVTVPPHRHFVQQIAADTVKVQLMVPAGASQHTFEPTSKQILNVSKADIWFTIGEPFEERAFRALRMQNPSLAAIDLRCGVNLIYCQPGDCGHHCQHCANHAGMDLHIWLSPKEAKKQAQTIAEALIERYPENTDLYKENLDKLLAALDTLDKEINDTIKNSRISLIFVAHPAYAYFARDYGITQLSLEYDGKDPTPRQLTAIIKQAQDAKIEKIYVQPQYSNKGAALVAREIGAELVELDPYAEDYFTAMRNITRAFSSQQKLENLTCRQLK